MIKKVSVMFLGLMLFTAAAAAAEIKIGVVDILEVIQRSEAGRKAFDSLSSEFKDMKDELDKQQKGIEALREELQKQSLVLSQEAKADKELEFKRKLRDFQDMYQTYQRKMQVKEQEYREPIVTQIFELLQGYGKEHGFTMIMDKKNSGLTYIADGLEITEDVILEFNKHWRNLKKDAK